jgi:hypothetical protein
MNKWKMREALMKSDLCGLAGQRDHPGVVVLISELSGASQKPSHLYWLVGIDHHPQGREGQVRSIPCQGGTV